MEGMKFFLIFELLTLLFIRSLCHIASFILRVLNYFILGTSVKERAA